MPKVIAIRRDESFSPNSVENDRKILESVVDKLSAHYGIDIPVVDEYRYANQPQDADIILSMGRLYITLAALKCQEFRGTLVFNSPGGVKRCQRSKLDALMRQFNIAMPPKKGEHGYWLKRGDAAAQSKDDIVYCPDEDSLALAKQTFLDRGIDDIVVSAHVEGDVVKFYGVDGYLFRYFYPSDDGITKFGDEKINGKAHHYHFDEKALNEETHLLSRLTGVPIYGGDAIIDKNGNFYIIDFNDWPSFWRCREEAAEAICQLIISSLKVRSLKIRS